MNKAKGGRGQRAENKYERFTVTLPPELKVYLDSLATAQGSGRSETLAKLLEEHRTAHTGMSANSQQPPEPDKDAPTKRKKSASSARKESDHTGMTGNKKPKARRKALGTALKETENTGMSDNVLPEASERHPVPAPLKPVRGKAAELLRLLSAEGAEMVQVGSRYGVEQGGEVIATFAAAAGGALLTRPGLLVETAPGRWDRA